MSACGSDGCGLVLLVAEVSVGAEVAGLALVVSGDAGEEFVDVSLMTNVENEIIGRRLKDGMESDGQLNDAEIWAEMATSFSQDGDELLPDFLSQGGELLQRELFHVGWGINRIEKACHKVSGES